MEKDMINLYVDDFNGKRVDVSFNRDSIEVQDWNDDALKGTKDLSVHMNGVGYVEARAREINPETFSVSFQGSRGDSSMDVTLFLNVTQLKQLDFAVQTLLKSM